MTRDVRNQIIRLSTDETLSEAFRAACRAELGDRPWKSLAPYAASIAFFAAILLVR